METGKAAARVLKVAEMEKAGKAGKAASLAGKVKVHLLQERVKAKVKVKATMEQSLV